MQQIIGAALRRQRRATVIAVTVGLATALLIAWADAAGYGLGLLDFVPLLIFAGAVLYQLSWRPSAAGLRVDESVRAFFAPPASIGFNPFVVGYLVYQYVRSVWLLSGLGVWLLAAGSVLIGLMVLMLWRRVPYVVLTPEGLVHCRHNGLWLIPWAAVDPSRPVGLPHSGRTVSVPVARPELITGSRPRWWVGVIAMRGLDVAPALLAGAVWYYLTNPQARPTIGTPAGYARLHAALGGGS